VIDSEEKKREDGRHCTSPKDLPFRRRRVDGFGDGDGDYFRGSNRNDVVDSRCRCDVERSNQKGILLERYRVADWSMDEDPESRWREDYVNLGPKRESDGDMMRRTTTSRDCGSTCLAEDSRRGKLDLGNDDRGSTHLAERKLMEETGSGKR
jgi:hypothetical protein